VLSGSTAFTIISDACTGRSIGPRKSCPVTVSYSPSAADANDSASLTATGRRRRVASAEITLSGSGAASGHIYWTDGLLAIGRADLNGQNANQSFITGAFLPYGVAVDGGHVYWANSQISTIGRADLNGQNANQSFISAPGALMVASAQVEHPAHLRAAARSF
jgi:hypothetical protein